MRFSRLTFFFLLLTIPATCFSWPGKVVSVADGDTIIVQHNDQQMKVRLYGIDCPEKARAFGQKAREMTTLLVAGRTVDVEVKNTDRYGRSVGLVSIDGTSLKP